VIPLPPSVYVVIAAVAIGFGTGWTVREWKADSDQLEAVEAAIAQGKEQQELADYKAGRYEDQRYDAHEQSVLRDTEIRTIYRDVEVPAECEPPAAALLVLDSAIDSARAQAAGEPIAAVPTDPGQAKPVPRP
jgi:hypothetical protein